MASLLTSAGYIYDGAMERPQVRNDWWGTGAPHTVLQVQPAKARVCAHTCRLPRRGHVPVGNVDSSIHDFLGGPGRGSAFGAGTPDSSGQQCVMAQGMSLWDLWQQQGLAVIMLQTACSRRTAWQL